MLSPSTSVRHRLFVPGLSVALLGFFIFVVRSPSLTHLNPRIGSAFLLKAEEPLAVPPPLESKKDSSDFSPYLTGTMESQKEIASTVDPLNRQDAEASPPDREAINYTVLSKTTEKGRDVTLDIFQLMKTDWYDTVLSAEPTLALKNGKVVGLQINQVNAGSILNALGALPGDVVTSVDGDELTSLLGIPAIIFKHERDKEIKIGFERDGVPTYVTLRAQKLGATLNEEERERARVQRESFREAGTKVYTALMEARYARRYTVDGKIDTSQQIPSDNSTADNTDYAKLAADKRILDDIRLDSNPQEAGARALAEYGTSLIMGAFK